MSIYSYIGVAPLNSTVTKSQKMKFYLEFIISGRALEKQKGMPKSIRVLRKESFVYHVDTVSLPLFMKHIYDA